jgi:hypothetical protein
MSRRFMTGGLEAAAGVERVAVVVEGVWAAVLEVMQGLQAALDLWATTKRCGNGGSTAKL